MIFFAVAVGCSGCPDDQQKQGDDGGGGGGGGGGVPGRGGRG